MGSRTKNERTFLLVFIQNLVKNKLYVIAFLSSLIFFWSGSFCYAQNEAPYSKQEINEQLEQAILEIDFELVYYILNYASERKNLDGASQLDDNLFPKTNPTYKDIKKLRPKVGYSTAKKVVAAIFDDYRKRDGVTDKNIVDKIYEHREDINEVNTFQDIETLLGDVTQTAITQIGQ